MNNSTIPPKEILFSQVAAAAYSAEFHTGFPALITVSQWAIESAWGVSAAPGHNYFGMKYAARHYSFYWAPTTEFYKSAQALDYALSSLSIKDPTIVSKPGHLPIEVRCQAKFAAFSSLSACIDDYIYLMTTPSGPYYKAFQEYKTSPNLKQLALSIAKLYATSPKYGDLLLTLMDQSNIKSAIERARQQAISLDLLSKPLTNPNILTPRPSQPTGPPEPTTTLTALLDTLGSSYLFFREPYFYLCDKLPDGSLSLPKPISASALGFGFQPIIDTQTGKLIWNTLPNVPNGPEDSTK